MKKSSFLIGLTALLLGVGILLHGVALPQASAQAAAWSKVYSPPAGSYTGEVPIGIFQTGDGGFFVTGLRDLTKAVMAIRLDTNGEIVWEKEIVYDGTETCPGNGDPIPRWVQYNTLTAEPTPEGYIVGGGTHEGPCPPFVSRGFLTKLNTNGEVQWSRRYFNYTMINDEPVYIDTIIIHVQPISNGRYIVSGQTVESSGTSPPNYVYHGFVMVLDPSGFFLSAKRLENVYQIYGIRETHDGHFILVGTDSHEETGKLVVVKLNANLNLDPSTGCFAYAYGLGQPTGIHEIQEVGGGPDPVYRYLVVGTDITGDSNKDIAEFKVRVVKLTENGDVVWENLYNETTDGVRHITFANDLRPTSDGGCVITGASQCMAPICPQSHVFVLKLKANGDIDWTTAYGGISYGDTGNRVTPTADGGYAVAAYTKDLGDRDVWLLKLDAQGEIPNCSFTPTINRTPDSVIQNFNLSTSSLLSKVTTDAYKYQDLPLSPITTCAGTLDSDRDGVPNSIDNCPHAYNPDQKDSDGDLVGDVCDNCPDTYNPDQADSNGNGVGNACETITKSISPTKPVPVYDPGEPITIDATFVNDTGADITVIKPDCYNTSFTLTSWSSGQTLVPACRYPKPYGIARPLLDNGESNPISSLIVIPNDSSFTYSCTLNPAEDPMFTNDQLVDDTFSIRATYANYLQDPDLVDGVCTPATDGDECYSLWRGSVTSAAETITVKPGTSVPLNASVTFEPSVWNTDWATMSGQRIKTTITGIPTGATVDLGSIRLNGTVPIINDEEAWNLIDSEPNALIVEFDGPAALLSLGTLLPQSYTVSVSGKINGNTNSGYFYASNSVTLQDRDPVLIVQVDKHIVGTGTFPKPSKTFLGGVPIRLYDKAPGSCAAQVGASGQYPLPNGISWQNYKPIWDQCAYDFAAEAASNGDNGQAIFSVVPPGNYLAIGKYTGPKADGTGTETIYIGVSVGAIPDTSVVTKYLQVMQNYKNQNLPGKYTKITGSDLMIIEPEYVEWSDQSEPYPFVFESLGEWAITTSVAPPEGFVADYSSLSTEVISQLKAIQFTITDIGSKWVPTKVKHRIKHKGKTTTIESSVGVKLKPGLARSKGVSEYGDKGK